MKIVSLQHPFLNFLSILSYPPDAGAGAGGDGGAGAGAGAGAGSGGGGGAPFKLSDDAMVDLGDGRSGKWGELRSQHYMPKESYDRGVKFLEGEATKLEKAWEKYHAGTGPKPKQEEPVDPLADIRDAAVIDGRQLSRLYETLQKNGLAPIAQVVASLAQQVKTLKDELGGVSKQTGALAGTRREQDFESHITDALSKVTQLKGLPEGVSIPTDDPWVREVAKDVFLSHDQASWKPGEFEKMLSARISDGIALLRKLDQQGLTVNKDRVKKKFFNPARGTGQGSGAPAYAHKRGAEMAADMAAAGMFGR